MPIQEASRSGKLSTYFFLANTADLALITINAAMRTALHGNENREDQLFQIIRANQGSYFISIQRKAEIFEAMRK